MVWRGVVGEGGGSGQRDGWCGEGGGGGEREVVGKMSTQKDSHVRLGEVYGEGGGVSKKVKRQGV